MPKKVKDVEIDIKIKMSQRLIILLTVGGWLWGFASTLYFSYVALTGQNPIIDITLGLPAFLAYLLGLTGVWGIIWACIIGWIIVMIIGAIIVKYRGD